jgi:hypothetical protein
VSDDELDRLARQDLSPRFAPPAPGSTRYQRILEAAMTTNTINLEPVETRSPKPRRRWSGWTAAVGVAASLIAVGVVVLQRPADPVDVEPPAAAMRLAADRVTEVRSVRFRTGPEPLGPGLSWSETEVSGGNIHRSFWRHGDTRPGSQLTRVGDDVYLTDEDGKVTKDDYTSPRDPTMEYTILKFAPFTRSAGRVIAAAAGDPTLAELGDETVAGRNTRHFRISLVERSTATEPVPSIVKLPPAELAWFELDGIDAYGTVTVDFWVSDDHLIRRVGISHSSGNVALDFYDFNEPFTIQAPKLG